MGSGNPQIPGIKSTEENLHMDQTVRPKMQVLIKDSLANLLGFCEKFPLKTFENSFSSLPLFLCLCHQQ